MVFDYDELWYEKENAAILDPELLSTEDLEEINEFLSDYDRTEIIEEFIVSKFSNISNREF
jgi:hypothetical protein